MKNASPATTSKPKPPSKQQPPKAKPAPSPAKTKSSVAKKPIPKKVAPAKKAPTVRSQPASVPVAPSSTLAVKPAVTTKQSQLIALLRSPSGATLAQMMKLTGWQPHTMRGMLSGSLRKRLGLDVRWQSESGVRVYRIVDGAA